MSTAVVDKREGSRLNLTLPGAIADAWRVLPLPRSEHALANLSLQLAFDGLRLVHPQVPPTPLLNILLFLDGHGPFHAQLQRTADAAADPGWGGRFVHATTDQLAPYRRFLLRRLALQATAAES